MVNDRKKGKGAIGMATLHLALVYHVQVGGTGKGRVKGLVSKKEGNERRPCKKDCLKNHSTSQDFWGLRGSNNSEGGDCLEIDC